MDNGGATRRERATEHVPDRLAATLADPDGEDAQRRSRILVGLTTCIADKGYNATTITDIARVARVSKTVVYAHFRGGKPEMLLELYARSTAHIHRLLVDAGDAARTAGLPWRDRLRAVSRAYLEGLAAGPAVARTLLVEVQAMGLDALPVRRRVIDGYVAVLSATAAELAATFPAEVRPVESELMLGVVGGINEIILARVERGEAAQLSEDADLVAALLTAVLERTR